MQDQHTPECIEQAECDECGHDEVRQTDREYVTNSDDADGYVYRELKCRACRETGTVNITTEGLEVSGAINYENATWNNVEEDDDE